MALRAPVAAAVAGALTLAAPAVAQATYVPFQMPSKQIACAYMSGEGGPTLVRCDMFFMNDRAVFLDTKKKAYFGHVTDTVADPKSPVLAYGHSRRLGVFTCTSRTSGLTCRNRKTHHGFRISRQAQELF